MSAETRRLAWDAVAFRPGGSPASWTADGRAWAYLVHAGPAGVHLAKWRRYGDGYVPAAHTWLAAVMDNLFRVRRPSGPPATVPELLSHARFLAQDWEDGGEGDSFLAAMPAWAPEVER